MPRFSVRTGRIRPNVASGSVRPGPLAIVFLAVVLGLSPSRAAAGERIEFPSLGGTTGLLNTPTANVASDGHLFFGYHAIDKRWSYEGRTVLDNRIWYLTVGFLPNLEVSIRATVLPGESLLEDVPIDAVDRMGSFRYRFLKEKVWPSLAVGIDDIKGTRRLHSFYFVGTKSVKPFMVPVVAEFSLGYGLRTFDAARYLLDKEFGGIELKVGSWASGILEYDSEKWNAGLRLRAFSRLSAQVGVLHMEVLSGGLAWTQQL